MGGHANEAENKPYESIIVHRFAKINLCSRCFFDYIFITNNTLILCNNYLWTISIIFF